MLAYYTTKVLTYNISAIIDELYKRANSPDKKKKGVKENG